MLTHGGNIPLGYECDDKYHRLEGVGLPVQGHGQQQCEDWRYGYYVYHCLSHYPLQWASSWGG